MSLELPASTFIFSPDAVTSIVKSYGTFNDAELRTIVDGNIAVLEDQAPVQHLLQLREQPFLKELEEALHPKVYQDAEAYRAAVCLGATMLRRYSDHEVAPTMDPQTLRVDPERSYLRFADVSLNQGFQKYGAWPIMTEDFADSLHYGPYFKAPESASYLQDLKGQLIDNKVGFVTAESDSQQDVHFSYFCKGLLDTMQLHSILGYEEVVAPRSDTVYDPDRHTILRKATADADLAKRWRVGAIAGVETSDNEPEIFNRWDATTLTNSHAIMSLGRAVAGNVQADERPDSPRLAVSFDASQESFLLGPDDLVLTRHGIGDMIAFGSESSPFINKFRSSNEKLEVLGLCREGMLKFMADPEVNPDTEDSALSAALYLAVVQRYLAPEAEDTKPQ
jgi:hypothetical protein